MGRYRWRSGAVVAIAATALVSHGMTAVDESTPVSAPVVRPAAATTDTATPAPPPAPAYAAVGALFSGGRHFCSASVVDSPAGDLVLTAAHCVQAGTAQELTFAPGYHDGVAPYGLWTVTGVFVPDGWTASAEEDLDFAFLTVQQAGNTHSVQSLTGAEELATGRGFVNDITIVGYPDGAESPVVCNNTTTQAATYQQEIACPGFPDGTSGGPWLTRDGEVIGVIGGYELGGTPDVSYSAYFDEDIQNLYDAAIR
ncbi:MAG TPA: serine protease [Amycolatopsis sp.]|nr:serine protease [Amycolatopsis sp.]